MYPRLFLVILLVLLSTFAPSLALPVRSSDTLSIGARLFDLSPDTTPLVSRGVDSELLVERGYEDDESDVLSRAINEDLFPRANRPKRTATEAAQRKAAVRAAVSTNQVNNAAKKIELKELAIGVPAYKAPKYPKYTYAEKKTKQGTKHITGGYRKKERDKGTRLPKQPKTPKANFAKGEHKTNENAVQKQAEAKARLQAKKAAGRNAHATANTRYAQTHGDMANRHDKQIHGNLPNRHDEYAHIVDGKRVVVAHGKDVRTGAYNLGMHDGQRKKKYPVEFRNFEQGPPDNRHQPLPHMVGTGHEYPINKAKNGYHPHHESQGAVRAIYQNNPAGGYNVQGVVSHDVTRSKGPGYMDHHQIHGTPAPAQLEGVEGTIHTQVVDNV